MVDNNSNTASSFTKPPSPRVSKFIWIGLAILTCGVGPLVIYILLAILGLTMDPNPNLVGPGMLMVLSFPLGLVCIVVGVIRTMIHSAAARKQSSTIENMLRKK